MNWNKCSEDVSGNALIFHGDNSVVIFAFKYFLVWHSKDSLIFDLTIGGKNSAPSIDNIPSLGTDKWQWRSESFSASALFRLTKESSTSLPLMECLYSQHHLEFHWGRREISHRSRSFDWSVLRRVRSALLSPHSRGSNYRIGLLRSFKC